MDDLEEARRRRLAEIQAAQRRAPQTGQDPDAAAQADAARAQDAAVERLLQQILEPEARERLQRVRMSRPDLAAEVIQQLVTLAQAGRLARRLSDADLKAALGQLTSQDRDIKITRK
ncbi:MAG: DNA-binding protein [Thermoplasmatota archaeon]|nr:DNA-binding protein [Halobacteriales archaeon]